MLVLAGDGTFSATNIPKALYAIADVSETFSAEGQWKLEPEGTNAEHVSFDMRTTQGRSTFLRSGLLFVQWDGGEPTLILFLSDPDLDEKVIFRRR